MIDFSQPVLVVDDLKTMTRIVDSMLRKCGFKNIEQVNDGKTALQRLKSELFLFVVADGEMPEMTGLELLGQVRAQSNFSGIPFIVMSANTEARYAEAAIAAGANAFLTKPFSLTTLQDVLKQLLQPS